MEERTVLFTVIEEGRDDEPFSFEPSHEELACCCDGCSGDLMGEGG